MAHWAKINDEGVVEKVIVTSNEDGDEGESWIAENLEGTWVKTSYNTYRGVHLLGGVSLRKNYAGIGFFYDQRLDAFIPPKPFDSWILNEEICDWEAPVECPGHPAFYTWNEGSQEWLLNQNSTGSETPRRPFESWIFDEAASRWLAPIEYPRDGKKYRWDEESLSWALIPADQLPPIE